MIRKFLPLLLFVVLCGAGCETTETVLPDEYGGWIEGTVSDGGAESPGTTRVQVIQIGDDGQVRQFETRTDEDGHYRIGVPNGRAIVRAAGADWAYFKHDGLARHATDADTLLIDGVLQRADFNFGRLQIIGPAGMIEGEEWRRANLTYIEPGSFSDQLTNEWFDEVAGELVAEFRLVPPGGFRVEIEVDDYNAPFFLPGSFRPSEADTIAVATGEMTTYQGQRPQPVAIAGIVPGLWDPEAGERAEVVICCDGDDYYQRTILDVACDAEGRFWAQLPAQGDVIVIAQIRDAESRMLGPSRWAGGQFRTDATVYSLHPDQETRVDFEPAGGLTIHALGDPELNDLGVNCYRHDDDSQSWYRSIDPGDSPEIINLTPGLYRLRCHGDGLGVPTFYGDVTDFEAGAILEIRPGEITDITVNMILAGRIAGRVVDEAGDPLPPTFTMAIHEADERYVTLHNFDLAGWYDDLRFQYDESTGEFEIRRLEPGDYKLRILHASDAWLWYPDADLWDDAESVSVPEGGDSDFIDWQLIETSTP